MAGAGSREVAMFGGGECRCAIAIGVFAAVIYWGCCRTAKLRLLDACALMRLPGPASHFGGSLEHSLWAL